MTGPWRSALRALARRRSVNVAYHGVDEVPRSEDPENLCVPPARFRTQLELLLEAGFEIVTVAELAERAAGGAPPPGLASLSFDDGLEDNHRVLLPILRELGVPATVYVTTGMIGGSNPWLRGGRYMTEPELIDLHAAGVELGAHSVTHPDMTKLDPEACEREVAGSCELLGGLTGEPVRTFAYPFGRYDDAAVEAVRRTGLIAAVAGAGRDDRNLLTMRRAVITGVDGTPSFVAKLWDVYDPVFASPPGRAARALTRGARTRLRSSRGARG